MKTTIYFEYTKRRRDRSCIKDEWIEYVISHPLKEVMQTDGRIKRWAKIKEMNKYLRVILLADKSTVHNAFFDRNFNEE